VFSNDTAVADPPSRDGTMQDWLPGGCPVTTEMGLRLMLAASARPEVGSEPVSLRL